MAHVIDPLGRDLGDVTDVAQLAYYQREAGFTIDGHTVPEPAAAAEAVEQPPQPEPDDAGDGHDDNAVGDNELDPDDDTE